jgi:hypothetical protein
VHATLTLDGEVVAEQDISFPNWGSGVSNEIVVPWTPEPDHAGYRTLYSNLTLREGGSTVASLTGDSDPFEVVLLEAVIAPNPVRGSLAAGRLRLLRLDRDADLSCHVLDAVGGEAGRFEGRVLPGQRITLDMLAGTDLPSGVYILLLDVRAPGGSLLLTDQLTFAYMR